MDPRASTTGMVSLSLVLLVLINATTSTAATATSLPSCKAWLVQSIPTDKPALARVPGVLATADVLRWLAGNSTKTLDVTAQYWQLLARPQDPSSGDYGYSAEEMDRFGAAEGRKVYASLVDAATRNVDIRILQHSGFSPEFDQESADLAAGRPNVRNVTLLMADWWGSGVVHTKVWLSDRKHVYIGSANNDWKSLTQVKELGIYLADCHGIARQVEAYFDNLWQVASLDPKDRTTTVWDNEWQTFRKVPCWSRFLPRSQRCRSPLPKYVEVPHVNGYPVLSDPYTFQIPIETPSQHGTSEDSEQYSSYVSFAPPELLFGTFQADEQAWVQTIQSVPPGGTVRINTMDWLGQSQYLKQTVYWPSLSSAISKVVFSKNATVKLLVAHWDHMIDNTDTYLKSLLSTNALCRSSKYNTCAGLVEVKYYEVPGYNTTGPAVKDGTRTGNLYPDFTRVNHCKYAVSDVRGNIGTSNLVWDYFYTTAGVSFGTYNPSIVRQLQQVFDSDWNSPYAVPVDEQNCPFTAAASSRIF